MEEKTNVMRLIEKKKVPYKSYSFGSSGAVNGQEVAAAMGKPPEAVCKTLVCVGRSGGHYVFVVPVCGELDLKKAAKSVGEKSVALIPQKELLPLTGYVHGGCSPIGMKKFFPTVIDSSAAARETFCFSGGKIGWQVELRPCDLAKLIRFTVADIAERE